MQRHLYEASIRLHCYMLLVWVFESPKLSNMSSKCLQNINYIIHTIFMNFEGDIVPFYYTS